MNSSANTKHYLVASDFDQTLSFNDSGRVLSEIMGISGFDEKVSGLAKANLVQQGAELAYLLRHDPEFRSLRREHLIAAGKQVRLKNNVDLLAAFFERGLDPYGFQFYVISASPQDVVQSALSAGYGKIAVLEELETKLQITPDRTIYMGDGSSDLFVMLHVNSREGYTIAVSEAKFLGRIARRTVLSDSALSVLVPIFEDILNWNSAQIREVFESYGLAIQEWDKTRTDWVALQQYLRPVSEELRAASRKTA